MKNLKDKMWLIIPVLVIINLFIKELVVKNMDVLETITIADGILNIKFMRHMIAPEMNLWSNPEAYLTLGYIIFALVVLVFGLYKNKKVSRIISATSFVVFGIAIVAVLLMNPYAKVLKMLIQLSLLEVILFFGPSLLDHKIIKFGWYLQLAGLIGNMIDMTMRVLIVDYIDILPSVSKRVYNLDDFCITFGGLLVFYWLIVLLYHWNKEKITGIISLMGGKKTCSIKQ